MKIREINIGCTYYISGCKDSDMMTLSEKDFENIIIFKTKDRITPIKLTKEILIKCGFNNNGYFYQMNGLTLKTTYDGFVLLSGQYSVGNEFYYLHELQNLYFALTKDELIFKL